MLGRSCKLLIGLMSLLTPALLAADGVYECSSFLAIDAHFSRKFISLTLREDLIPSYGQGRLPAGCYRLDLNWHQEGYSLYSLNISRHIDLSPNDAGSTYLSVDHSARHGFETIDITHYTRSRPPSSLFYRTLACRGLPEDLE